MSQKPSLKANLTLRIPQSSLWLMKWSMPAAGMHSPWATRLKIHAFPRCLPPLAGAAAVPTLSQSGVSMTRAATMGRGSVEMDVLGRCLGGILASEATTPLTGKLSASLLWRLYEMFPYSWSSGHAPRRNWQKSLRIPNHPGTRSRRIKRLGCYYLKMLTQQSL